MTLTQTQREQAADALQACLAANFLGALPAGCEAGFTLLYALADAGFEVHPAGVAGRLRTIADAYWSDARVFADQGDQPMAAAYRAIADELRATAKELG